MATNSRLFTPLKVGTCTLQHRIVMAPLTRMRADSSHVPILPLVREYYAQRAANPGSLLITEATFIAPQAGGLDSIPGLWTQEQLAAWRKVTNTVHEHGSYIFCQLWALGRAASQSVLEKEGFEVVSSSPVPMGPKAPTPRALREDEIREYVQAYATAARNAVEIAGFDGVEIHAANGYLIDQFTQDTCNQRTDAWGGSVEKRARFGLEVAKAVVQAVGAEKVGIRLSPFSTFQGMRMAEPEGQFSHLVRGLRELRLAYLHLVESRVDGNQDGQAKGDLDFAIQIWGDTSPVFVAGGYNVERAVEKVDKQYPGRDIAVVFGRDYISNPDLAFRIQAGVPLSKYNRKTFYKARSPEGYTDYPFSEKWSKFSALL